jgi:hypothetical protein
MNLLSTIEKANYVADDATVEKLAAEYAASVSSIESARGTYFRILVATTQQAIAGKPTLRARSKGGEPLDEAELSQHLEAFEAAHARLYAIVMKAGIPPELADHPNLTTDESNRRASERNRRTNYARSAASTLRSFIRGGGDVLRLSVPIVTKSAVAAMTLRTDRQDGKPGQRDRERVERAADRVVANAEALAESDKGAAVLSLQLALAKIATALSKIGPKSTTKPAVALEEHRPLKTPQGMFWPTNAMQQ